SWHPIAPSVDIWPDHIVGGIDIIAVQTRAMHFLFPDHAEMSNRRAMALAPARNSRSRDQNAAPIKVSLLFAQIDHDRSPAAMSLRHVRLEHLGHRSAAAQRNQQAYQAERSGNSNRPHAAQTRYSKEIRR